MLAYKLKRSSYCALDRRMVIATRIQNKEMSVQLSALGCETY